MLTDSTNHLSALERGAALIAQDRRGTLYAVDALIRRGAVMRRPHNHDDSPLNRYLALTQALCRHGRLHLRIADQPAVAAAQAAVLDHLLTDAGRRAPGVAVSELQHFLSLLRETGQ